MLGKKKEVARKNAVICKRKASKYLFSLFYTCLEENQWESLLNSYLRMKTSDEEVYEEERHHGIADWGQGVVRWWEEKACTGTGFVHLGDQN